MKKKEPKRKKLQNKGEKEKRSEKEHEIYSLKGF